jgi:hypothetical protein
VAQTDGTIAVLDLDDRPAVDTELLRERLLRLHDLATEELQRRRTAAELEPVEAAPVPIEALSSISRELPRLARNAPRAAATSCAACSAGRRRSCRGRRSWPHATAAATPPPTSSASTASGPSR